MKKILIMLSLACLAGAVKVQAADLINLGSDGFAIDGGSIGTYAQSSTNLTFTAVSLTDSIFGFTVAPTVNLGDPPFGIRMTINGVNPDLLYFFEFYDSTFTGGPTGFSKYSGSTVGLATGMETTNSLTLVSPGANLTDIIGVGISFGGDTASMNVSMGGVVAVPEPHTYALLVMGALGLGAHVVRQRGRR